MALKAIPLPGFLPVGRLSTSYTTKYGLSATSVLPVFSRIFHKKFRFPFLEPQFLLSYNEHGLPITQIGVRNFSVRSGMVRPGSGSGNEVRVGKSLIEDEAELSDWVSGLSSNSFRKSQVYSDSDTDGDNGDENGGYKNKLRGEKRMGKQSEFDNDDSDFSSRRGGGRGGSAGKFSSGGSNERRNGGYSRGGPVERRNGGYSSGGPVERRNGGYSSAGPVERRNGGYSSGGQVERRNGGYSNGGPVERRNGGYSSAGSIERRNGGYSSGGSVDRRNGGSPDRRNGGLSSRGPVERFGGRELGTGNGSRGERRGGARGSDMGYAKNRDAGVRVKREEKRVPPQRGLVVSDEEEDEVEVEGYKSFKDLIDSEDEDEDESEEDTSDDDAVEKEKVWPQSPPSSTGENDTYLSESRFDQCSISPLTMKGLKDIGYEKMTVVQEATLPVILKGKDVLAKAKTGTGKTVAFLLPAIEAVIKSPADTLDQKRSPIHVLVICPTRELASQAAAEANKLLKYHASIGVQVVIGGTRLTLEQKRMQANPCQILVATPGRLKDHTENTAGFATRLMGVKVLVLDEADHLLDMGFRRDIERIIAAVPKQRQTLLFSATIPPEVRQVCHIALRRDHEFINTVQEGSEETHAQVRQMHMVAPLDKHFSLLYSLLKDHIADDVNYKILVFCTTAMVTRLVAELLGELNLNVREIHSRKSQSYRTKVSDEFRKSKGLILVTSDVSARGVDYPDVTLVVQIGVPADRQQYIHRLGRTGRKGKEGQGILMLAPWEEYFLSTLKDLPLTKAPEPLVDPEMKKKVERALSHVGMKEKESAYQAWLGYYNSNKNVGRDKYRLVELANEFSRTMGLDDPPAIPKLVLGKMGLKNIPGLRSK